MNYFKNEEGKIFGYDEEQVAAGLGNTLTAITEAEMQTLTYVEPTPEEVASLAKQTGEVYTLNGVDYQVPFLKDDADGLMQVNAAFTLGLTDTVIYFTNGTKMPIAAADFQAFAVWFVTKRNAFFTA